MNKAPELIYLQWAGTECESTWCSDQINDEDIEYVKKDTAAKRLELLREIKVMLGYCPYCWANFKEPCARGCKMGKELGDGAESKTGYGPNDWS